MLSSEDHSGVVYFLIGIVVIVFTAVGLSMLVDQRFRFSSGVGVLKREVALQTEEIADMTLRHDLRSATLAEELAKRGPTAAGRQEALAKIAATTTRMSELRNSQNKLRAELAALETAFTKYRSTYREKTWAKAVGQEIGNLTIRGGRQYHQATITKVTDVGLEIRHEHGIARIQAPDLDSEWQDRFQWSDEERRARLNRESEDLEDKPPVSNLAPRSGPDFNAEVASSPSAKFAPAQSPDDPAQLENIKQLRTQVIGWRSKVSRLSIERAEASSNASYGKQTSVPGSLETWDARAVRLARELARAQTELSLAKARLAALAPSDPSLGPFPGENR